MSHEPVVNWVVPLSPVLSEVTSVPPIRIKTTVCKSGYLSTEIGPSMKNKKEHSKPDIRTRDSNIERREQDIVIVSVFKMDC